jgi:hypothetical protein
MPLSGFVSFYFLFGNEENKKIGLRVKIWLAV